jgi:cytochrome b subunit of formate dehydrogenase
VVQRTGVDNAPIDAYLRSVHGKALFEEGNASAPTCNTCHPAHTMLSRTDPNSTIHRANVPMTCGMCHSEIAEIYIASVHGAAAMKGIADSPVCTDCHGEHAIKGPDDPESSVFPANIAKTTCTRCHESLILSRRYGFTANRIATFRETYHGLASEKGALNVANCASCHGIHNIFPSSDPRSTVHAGNLQETCGGCHPDATAEFASIQVHPEISGDGAQAAPKRPRDIARSIYVWILVVAVAGMVIHNAIIWIFHVVEKRRREVAAPRVRRFLRFESVEHLLLLTSFFTLVFTGFALKFPDAGWVRITEGLGLSEHARSIVHRVAAVAMMAVSVTHIGFLLFTRAGRREILALRPTIGDVRDFLGNMRYHLRLSSKRPVFPHFDYTEKFEYLALIWGTIVMVLTGLVLWFPNAFTRWLPGWSIEVSEVIHYYEAWLAFLAILIWHFFYVIFHPESHPMNLTWIDGKIPVEAAIHKHGRLEDGQKIELPPPAPPSGDAGRSG